MSRNFHTEGLGVRCRGCTKLWAIEALRAGVEAAGGEMTPRHGLAHPDCLELHSFEPFEFGPRLEWVSPPYGPVLACSAQFDTASELWLSDVAVTLPLGSDNIALVAGGAGNTPAEAVSKGWFEGLERRSAYARPRGPVRLSIPGNKDWVLHGEPRMGLMASQFWVRSQACNFPMTV